MKKKSTATTTPSKETEALIPSNSLFEFVLKGFNNPPSSSSAGKKKSMPISATKSSVVIKATANVSSPSPMMSVASVSDLKDLVSSRSDSLKRQLDLSHAEILKEFEASGSRISKRFKMQTQTCQQMTDEADKEYRRLSDLINENVEAMKTSYVESITKVEASTNRVCKTLIPELAQSMEKAIEGLRNSYGIPMNAR